MDKMVFNGLKFRKLSIQYHFHWLVICKSLFQFLVTSFCSVGLFSIYMNSF